MKMRKTYISWMLMLVSILVLTACTPASEQARTSTPGGTDVSGTDGTDVATEDLGTEMMETPTMDVTMDVTEDMSPTADVTEESTEMVTVTPEAGTAEVTEVLPPTGAVDPNRVTNILDFPVWNQNNEQIGEVGDLILNADTQMVDYVVVELGGFLGLGESRVPIPWRAVQVRMGGEDDPQNALIIMADQEMLESAPVLEDDMMPAMGQDALGWDADFMTFWDTELGPMATGTPGDATPSAETPTASTPAAGTPEATGTPDGTGTPTSETPVAGTPVVGTGTRLTGVISVNELLGMNVQIAGENVGEIEDILIDMETGDVRYIVVSADTGGAGTRLIPVPLGILGWDADNEVIVLMVDQNTLDTAPGFEDADFPDTSDPNWDLDIPVFWDPFIQDTDTE